MRFRNREDWILAVTLGWIEVNRTQTDTLECGMSQILLLFEAPLKATLGETGKDSTPCSTSFSYRLVVSR